MDSPFSDLSINVSFCFIVSTILFRFFVNCSFSIFKRYRYVELKYEFLRLHITIKIISHRKKLKIIKHKRVMRKTALCKTRTSSLQETNNLNNERPKGTEVSRKLDFLEQTKSRELTNMGNKYQN